MQLNIFQYEDACWRSISLSYELHLRNMWMWIVLSVCVPPQKWRCASQLTNALIRPHETSSTKFYFIMNATH